jgi:hypothetical protein
MRHNLSKLALAPLSAAALLASGALHAQAPDPGAVRVQAPDSGAMTAVRLAPGESIRLDGTLDHPAWRRAPVFSGFVEKDPTLGAKPSHETRVQVLFDDKAVYVGITALDPEPEQIRAPLVRHDAVLRTQDFVVVYFDPIGKRQSAQFFRVNAAGSTADGMHTASDDSEDFSPDFDFDAASSRNARGYTTVLRVPFASLRYTSDTDGGWRIMVGRRVPREQFALYTSVLVPAEAMAFIAAMQPLKDIALPEASQFVTLRPSATLRHERADEPGLPSRRDDKIQGTLDMKWRPMAELVIDGTIKPDFSQIDLDVPQLGGNSRYALFYPEKRPFFFEASDLLRSPTDALYTRSFTAPSWGLRATWRGATVAGTAIAVDDRGGGLTLLPGAYGTGYADQPASRTLAMRKITNGGHVQFGAMLAARRYEDDGGDNVVLGPDLSWQLTDQLRLRAQWLHARTSAHPDDAGGLRHGALVSANQIYLKAVHQTDNTQTDATINDIGNDFRNDTGFANQSGVRLFDAHYGRVWRNLGRFNELWANFYAKHTRDRVTGETIKSDIYPGIWFSAAANTQALLELHGLSSLRTASQGPMLRERYVYGEYSVTPAKWIPLVESTFSLGRLADVVADTVRPGAKASLMVRMRVLPQLELEPRISIASLARDGKQTYRETATQLNGIWFFNAAQNLRLIVQHTALDRRAEPGVAEAHDQGKVASLTYTWRRSAGTVLYVGASHSRTGVGATSRGGEAFVKLQFDADEMLRMF